MNHPNTYTARDTRRTPWWRSVAMFCALMLLGIAQSYGQTTLISPTGDGGFETGPTFLANGWTEVNTNPVTPANQWYCGSPAILGHTNRLAYISNDAGVSNTYTNNADSRVAFYRTVNFPAGESAITLSFTIRCTGEGTYDGVQVALVPTTTSITSSNTTGGGTFASILPLYTGATILGASPAYWTLGANVVTVSITVPASFAGTTQQLVFSWRNDTSVGTNPPGSVDNISLVSAFPSPATCPTAYVPADLATLVPTNQVLSWSGAGGAPSPTYDVYFSTNSALVAAKDPSVRVLTGTAATTYAPAMAFATQYYWMVVPTNASGGPATCAVNSFTTAPPSVFTTTATGGLWSSPGTWVGGVVPATGNNILIPAGAVVTVDQVINYLNYQVDGVMQWNATANAMTCTGNFDVGATGRFYPMTTGLAAVTLNFLGNFTNAGYADLAAASMIFGGSGAQNLNNSGTLVGNGTKAIVRVLHMQGSGSLNINTPIIISGNINPLIGTINTNGNLELDNTAQVFGQVQNGRIEEAVVTAMGSLLPAAPEVTGTWPAGTTGLWVANSAAALNNKLISGGNVYLVTTAGTTDAVLPPVHTSGIAANGTAQLLWLGPAGVIGTGFQVTAALTAGTQIWYGTNLYTVTVGGIASAIAPPTHLAGTAVSGAATMAYAGTAARVSVNYDAANQVVRSLNIVNAGSGYFASPAIGFATASGTNPTALSVVIPIFIGTANNLAQKQATATVSGALPINVPGTQGVGAVGASGSYGYYTAAPTVGVSGPSLVNFVTSPGAGYTSVPVITFTGGTIISGTNTFTTTVAAGQVVSCYLTASALYSVPPTGFNILGGGGAGLNLTIPAGCWAQVQANLNAVGQLASYTVTTPGFGYVAAPSLALSAVTAPQVAAVTPTCRIGLYNLTISNFLAASINGVTPTTVNAPHTEANLGPLMPASRRINVLAMGAGNQGFTLSGGNLELYAAAPITLTAGILSTGANTLVFSNPNYAGQAGSVTSSVLGKVTLTNIGGTVTRTFPFQAAFAVNTGTTNNAVPFAGNTATTFSAIQVGAPSGSVGITGTRAYRLQLPGGTTFGNNPTATLNWNVNDLLNSDQPNLVIAQSTALTGPWTVRSIGSGTGGLPATGSRTTAVGAPGPITISGDDYFAWSSTYVPVNLNYTVTRTTGNTFNSIISTGSSVGSIASTDDGTSPALSIPASTFQYLGQTVTGFNVCTNGWIKLITASSPSTSTTSFSNVISAAIPLIVAPFWDDLTTNPNSGGAATVDARTKYQIIGGTPGSRQIVVEWNNYTVFGAAGPSLTFQVVLDETDNSIKFNYGLFQGFNGTNNHRYTYTTGIGGSVINGNPLPGQVFAMQYENTTAFSNAGMVLSSQGANAMSSMPECNSSIKLTPGTYAGFTPPAETAPANDEPAAATVLTPQLSFPSNLCGNFYSSRFATPSAQTVCSGNADDDVWFRFTASQPVYTARVYGSGGYRPRVEVLNAPSLTPLAPSVCVVSTGDGGVVDALLTGLTVSNDYYIRVYHEGGGVQAVATANLNASGNVISFNVVNGGSGYSSTTTGQITTNRVRITGGGGTDAAATITQTGGVVTNVTLQTGGYGYTSAPTVTIEKPNWAHIGEFALVLFAPLPNDDCAGAFTITPQLGCSPTAGNSNGGTPSATIPACVGNPDDDVWYTFTPTVANPTITVVGDVLYDAVVQVFSGTCGTLTSLYCQNATGNGGTETVATTGLTTGVPHFVRIYHNGTGASTGLFSICVDQGGASCPVQTSPVNNTSLPDLLGTTLTWNASAPNAATGYDVYFGTDNPPTTIVSTDQAGTSYVTGPLLCNTSYYWMVRPRNALGVNSTCSTVLTFTTPTSVTCPTVYAPLSGATNVSTAAQTLSWNSIGAGSSYTVYFDTNPNPGTVLTTTTGLTAITGVLACNTQYYWRVEPTNCVGTNTTCVVNTFSTTSAPPPCVSISSPANLASNLPLVATTLSWLTAGPGATGYDVYFGTNQADVQNGTGGTFLATVTGTSTTTPVLACNTQYFWRVAPINCFGTNTTCATSTFFSLNQTPNCATTYTPANNATGVLYSPTLTWGGATGSISSYNVYLGTVQADVAAGTGGTFLGNTLTASIPAPGLACNTVYYWRVEPLNCVGANVNCVVNTFTTYALAPTCPTAFTPANNAINVAFLPTLTYTGAVGATSYNIYLDVANPPLILHGTSLTTSYTPGSNLAPGTWYWRVEPFNCIGAVTTCAVNTFNIPSCPPVTALTVAAASVTTASVSFTCAGCVGTYIVEYGLSGFTPGTAGTPGAGGTIVTSGSSPVAISGLLANSTYSFYVRQECTPSVDYSTNVGPVNLTTPEVLCGQNFYDNGGAAGVYTNNANVVRTFCGANPGEVVIASFNSFSTESGWDPLYIYNGPSIASPQFASTNGVPSGNNVYGTGGWWGTQIAPGTAFVSTHPTGCLTFAFTSDPSVTAPGWDASIACAPPTACTVPTGVTASSITASSAQIAWTCSGCVGPYIVEWGLAGFTPGTGATAGFGGTAIPAAASPVTLTGLPAGQNIVAYVRQDCNGGNTLFSNNSYGPANFTTLPGCGGNYYDLGGPTGLYPNNINGTAGLNTICPNNAGDRVIVTFSSFQVESSWDPLYVYNGPTTASPQIASTNGAPITTPNFGAGGWWGTVAPTNTGLPGTVISTHPSGCLTFNHISDGSVNQAGWTATVACVTPQFTCSTAGTIACGETKTGFTIGGTNTLPPTAQCDFNGGPSTSGVSWFAYTAVADTNVTMSTCGGVMNTRISVFSGVCTSLTCVGGVDDGAGCPNGSTDITFRAAMGQTYYIAVHGNAANDGVFQLSAFCSPLCTVDPNDNDACGTAMAITSQLADGSQVIMTDANSCSYVDGPPTCSGAAPAIGNWYSFNAGANAVHNLYLWNNALDAQFTATTVSYALFSGTCTDLLATDQVNCTTPGNGANVLPALIPGNDYKLFVYNDGSTSQRGSYGLVLDHPGVNDASISAVTYPVGVLCNLVLVPQVVLTNEGEATLTSVDITVAIDAGVNGSYVYPWTGSLASGASVSLTLDPITTPSGPHSMTVSTSNPNGAVDEIPANDATTVSYDATGQTIVVSISTDNIGGQTSWELFDSFYFLVGSGGPYTGQNNVTINTSVCLPTTFGNCFYFVVQDAGGDGMCCLNGTGSWELRDETGRIVLHDNGSFTTQSPSTSPVNPSYFAHEFCLPLGPSPILASECNIFTNTMQSKVYTAAVPGVTTYQFEFSDPNAGFRRRIALPRPWVQFAEMVTSPLTPGTVYFARARVDQYAAGFWDDNFGAGCDMSIDPGSIGCPALINNTSLPTHSCGVTKSFGGSDKIWAQPLFGATAYRFRFVNTGEGYVREIQRPTYVCLLSWVTNPLVNGSTYTVTVNALVGTTWTGYCGAACSVTILNPAVNGDNMGRTPETVVESDVQLWPNPVRDGIVNLRIDELVDATQRITVDMYDVYGKRVMTNEYENGGAVFSTVLDLDASIAAGVYTVNITVNDKQFTQRLTVVR